MFNLNRFDYRELKAVGSVLESGELSGFYKNFRGGEKVQEFEENFAKYHGVRHAIAMSSGTASLMTAQLACGITRGDRVVTTPYTFVASASSIVMTGATPLFMDIDRMTYNMRTMDNYVKAPRVKAIVAVHMLGNPCGITKKDVGDVFLIEDCAQALGAKYNGKLVGTLGDLGCFSFQHTKTITTGGEGGMIITDNEELAEKCRRIRNHGEKYAKGSELGYNFRMTEIQAAIGIEQLKKLDYFNKLQIENARYIIRDLPGQLTTQETLTHAEPVYFVIGCRYGGKHKEDIFTALTNLRVNRGLPGRSVGAGYPELVYQLPYFKRWRLPCPEAEAILSEAVWIDIHRFRPLEAVKKDWKMVREAVEAW